MIIIKSLYHIRERIDIIAMHWLLHIFISCLFRWHPLNWLN